MPNFQDNGQAAWNQYHKGLLSLLGGAEQGPTVVQPLAIAQRVEWDTNSPEYNLFLKQDIAEAVPSWTPLYTRSMGRTVPDEYLAFLDELNSKLIHTSTVNTSVLQHLNLERKAVRDSLEALSREANNRWKLYLKETPAPLVSTRAKWEEDMGISGQRKNYQEQLAAAEGAYLLEANNVGGDVKEVGRAIIALGSAIQQVPLPSSPEEIQLGKDYWSYYYRASLDGDIFQFKNEASPLSITMNDLAQQSTSFSSKWNASASVGWCCFFSASGKMEDEVQSTKWKQQTSEVKVNFKNIKPFNIIRGQWYKPGLITRFLDRLPASFWSESGRLNLIPTQLIVAHGLSIDITTSDEVRDYFYHRHSVGGGGGFSIGPFSLGGGGSSTSTYSETNVVKTATGLHIEDTSGRAVVLAVISTRPQDLLHTSSTPMFLALNKAEKTKANAQWKEAMAEVEEPALAMTLR